VLVSVAANDTRTIAVAQGPDGDDGPASVVVEDRGDWRLVRLPGVPSLARVVAYGDGFLAVSRAGDVFSVWWSLDGDAWSAVPGVVQPPGVESVAGEVDVVARGDQVVIVARADTADAARAGGYALVGTP
jgi:hypothetical protein